MEVQEHGITNMSTVVKCKITPSDWNLSRWQKRFKAHLNQDNVRHAIHQVYLDMSEQYIPYRTGALTESGRVLKDGIHWGFEGTSSDGRTLKSTFKRPRYAIYPYRGIARNGHRMIFNRTVHPLAQSHWDKAVLRNDGRAFKWRVTHELKQIARDEGW